MSTPLQRTAARLQLRKPAPPGGAPSTPSAIAVQSRPSAAPEAAASRPPAEPPACDASMRFLRARAAQLERQVVAAAAEVRSRDALVADAVAALHGIRAHAASAGAARTPEEAQPLLRALDAYARATAAKCAERHPAAVGEDDDGARWRVPFEPAAGNRFLAPPPAAGSWGGEDRITVAGAAAGEARALVQGARVAALEEQLATLAPALQRTALRLAAGEPDDDVDDVARQVDAAAKALAELAALAPTRGFLFGAAAQPRRAGAAPSAAKKAAAAKPGGAARPAAAAAGVTSGTARVPDLGVALASLPPFVQGRELEGRDALARLLRDAAAAEAAWAVEREAMRAELVAARSAAAGAAPAMQAQAAELPPALRAAAPPLRRVLAAGAAVEAAPSEVTLKALVAAISSERPPLDAALAALDRAA